MHWKRQFFMPAAMVLQGKRPPDGLQLLEYIQPWLLPAKGITLMNHGAFDGKLALGPLTQLKKQHILRCSQSGLPNALLQ